MNKIIIKLAVVVIMTTFATACANWVPEDALIDLDSSAFNLLYKRDYTKVKTKVLDELKGSWCSEEKVNLLMDLVYLTKPETCVEIGTFTGSSLLPIATALQLLNHGIVYAIDAWSNQEAVKGLSDNDPNRPWWSSLDMTSIRSTCDQLVNKWKLNPFCNVIQAPSEQAVNQIGEIDFLHLDGNFSESGALEDVQLYLPKVKEGGYILLSNLFIMSNGKQPKLKSFCALFESCEIVSEIENDNAILFRKL